MVMNVTADLSSIKGIETQIIQRIQRAKFGILNRAAQIARQRMVSDPIVFIRHAQAILMEMQSFYYDGGSVAADDPATFETAGGQSTLALVDQEIRKNLPATLEVIVTENSFDWSAVLLSNDFIGLSTGGEGTEGIPWIAFFIAGGIKSGNEGEELIWINNDLAQKLNFRGAGNLGRFGKGFLMVNTPRLSAAILSVGYNPKDFVHPISFKPGSNWFAELPNRISQDPSFRTEYIDPAIEQATQEVISKIISRAGNAGQ